LPAYSGWRLPFSVGLAVSVVSTGATARVRVVPTASDITAPTLAATSYTATSSTGGQLSWTPARDDGQGVIGYQVMVDGSPSSFASRSATSTAVAFETGATSLCLQAVDAAGNVASSANLLPGGSGSCSSAPSGGTGGSGGSGSLDAPVITSPADGLLTRSRDVYLTWNAPTGLVTGYQVYLNGQPVGRVLRSTLRRARVSLPQGSVTLGVSARDITGAFGTRAERTITVDSLRPAGPGSVRLALGTTSLS
jgi:hypothetical protein